MANILLIAFLSSIVISFLLLIIALCIEAEKPNGSCIFISNKVESLPDRILRIIQENDDSSLCVISTSNTTSSDSVVKKRINAITSQLSRQGYFLTDCKNSKLRWLFKKANNDDDRYKDENKKNYNMFIIGYFMNTELQRLASIISAASGLSNINVYMFDEHISSEEQRNLLISCLSSKRFVLKSENIEINSLICLSFKKV